MNTLLDCFQSAKKTQRKTPEEARRDTLIEKLVTLLDGNSGMGERINLTTKDLVEEYGTQEDVQNVVREAMLCGLDLPENSPGLFAEQIYHGIVSANNKAVILATSKTLLQYLKGRTQTADPSACAVQTISLLLRITEGTKRFKDSELAQDASIEARRIFEQLNPEEHYGQLVQLFACEPTLFGQNNLERFAQATTLLTQAQQDRDWKNGDWVLRSLSSQPFPTDLPEGEERGAVAQAVLSYLDARQNALTQESSHIDHATLAMLPLESVQQYLFVAKADPTRVETVTPKILQYLSSSISIYGNHVPLYETALRDKAVPDSVRRAVTKDLFERSASAGGQILYFGLSTIERNADKAHYDRKEVSRLLRIHELLTRVSSEFEVSRRIALYEKILELSNEKERPGYVLQLQNLAETLYPAEPEKLQHAVAAYQVLANFSDDPEITNRLQELETKAAERQRKQGQNDVGMSPEQALVVLRTRRAQSAPQIVATSQWEP